MISSSDLAPTFHRVEGHNGVGIHVWDYGGDGPPLILSHCTGTCARVWDPIASTLLPHFRVLAPDTRGHGDSDTPADSEAYAWIETGRDLLNVIETLELGTGIVAAGHSAGAAQIAYAEWMAPGTFRKAVLIDPIIGPPEAFRGDNLMSEAARRRRNEFESRDYARERFASKPPMNAWDPRALDAYVAYALGEDPDGVLRLKCPPEIEAEIYARSGSADLFEHLGVLALEVMLVTSDHSNVRVLAEAQRPLFRNCHFEDLTGPSHFIPQECPDEVADLIFQHLRR